MLKSDISQQEGNTESALNFCRSNSEKVLVVEEIVAKSNTGGLTDLVSHVAVYQQANATITLTDPSTESHCIAITLCGLARNRRHFPR